MEDGDKKRVYGMNLQGIIDMMWPDDEDGRNGCIMTGLYAASLVAVFAACLFLSGCSPRVIERTIVKTDTVRMNHTAMDSIYVIDSVFVHEWHEGDTVRIETTRWRDRWRELVVHDSVYVAKTDTLRVVSAGKPQSTCPTGWQWFQIWVGRIALVALAFVLTFKIIKRWL